MQFVPSRVIPSGGSTYRFTQLHSYLSSHVSLRPLRLIGFSLACSCRRVPVSSRCPEPACLRLVHAQNFLARLTCLRSAISPHSLRLHGICLFPPSALQPPRHCYVLGIPHSLLCSTTLQRVRFPHLLAVASLFLLGSLDSSRIARLFTSHLATQSH